MNQYFLFNIINLINLYYYLLFYLTIMEPMVKLLKMELEILAVQLKMELRKLVMLFIIMVSVIKADYFIFQNQRN